MNSGKHDSNDIETRLHNYFQKLSGLLKADQNLWLRLKTRLGEQNTQVDAETIKTKFIRWFTGPRLVIVSTSIAVILILITVGSVWLASPHTRNAPASPGLTNELNNGANPPTTTRFTVTDSTPSQGPFIIPGTTMTTIAIPAPTQIIVPGTTSLPPPAGTTGLHPAATTATVPATTQTAAPTTSGSGSAANSYDLDTIQQDVIYEADVSVTVDSVATALTQVQTIAESMGGMVGSMSSTEGQDQQQATITIRVPQDQFLTALSRLAGLGTIQSQQVTSQDVTEQFIDLQARLKSAQLEEQSFQALLDKANTVDDILTIQEQLTQIQTQIEDLQGQIDYTQHRIDLATINVTLNVPTKNVGQPPSGSLTVLVPDVESTLASVKQLVASVKGIVDSDSISLDNGKESAYLSLRVYR